MLVSACMVIKIGGGFIIQFWTKRGHVHHSLSERYMEATADVRVASGECET